MDSIGYLSVMVLNANGALPVYDAWVKIESDDEYDRITAQTATTDVDGKTEIFALPAPSEKYSLTPSPEKSPSAYYKVSVIKEGFYSRILLDVPIFANIYSTLTVSLVPYSLYNEMQNRPTVPHQNYEQGERV